MKPLTSTIALTALLAFAATPRALADNDTPCQKHCVATAVKCADGSQEPVICKVVVAADADGANVSIHPLPLATALAAPCAVLAADPQGDGAWLGVQLGEVPAPLAAHLALENGGVLIVNVVNGSPADQAGLQRWDIITEIDGQPAGDIVKIGETIGAKAPDSTIDLKIIRDGKPQTIPATLSRRPADAMQWKHTWGPGTRIEEHIGTRGHMLMRDDDGNWTFKSLGALDDLPVEVQKLLPQFNGITTRILREDDREHITLKVLRGGQTIEIEKDESGQITVRRTVGEGDEKTTTAKTYDNEDALREADEEAHDLYTRMKRDTCFIQHGPDAHSWTIDISEHLKDRARWQEEVGKAFREAHKAYEDAMRQVEEARRRVEAGSFGAPDDGEFSFRPFGDQATHSFRVEPDGQITLTIRKGDSEVIQVFASEDDLKTRQPDLYERYDGVRSAPTE